MVRPISNSSQEQYQVLSDMRLGMQAQKKRLVKELKQTQETQVKQDLNQRLEELKQGLSEIDSKINRLKSQIR